MSDDPIDEDDSEVSGLLMSDLDEFVAMSLKPLKRSIHRYILGDDAFPSMDANSLGASPSDFYSPPKPPRKGK